MTSPAKATPSRIDFSYVLTDVQDGCNNPQNRLVTSTDVGGGTSSTTSGSPGVTTSILAPNGGLLNPNLSPEPAVVVGARLSDRFRSDTPGLIFAQCDAYPLAEPGIIYDNDDVIIYWSWFAKTQDEISRRSTTRSTRSSSTPPTLPMTSAANPVQRNGDYWIFYTATVGHLRRGITKSASCMTWANAINDGYDDYGPGTASTSNSGTVQLRRAAEPR